MKQEVWTRPAVEACMLRMDEREALVQRLAGQRRSRCLTLVCLELMAHHLQLLVEAVLGQTLHSKAA